MRVQHTTTRSRRAPTSPGVAYDWEQLAARFASSIEMPCVAPPRLPTCLASAVSGTPGDLYLGTGFRPETRSGPARPSAAIEPPGPSICRELTAGARPAGGGFSDRPARSVPWHRQQSSAGVPLSRDEPLRVSSRGDGCATRRDGQRSCVIRAEPHNVPAELERGSNARRPRRWPHREARSGPVPHSAFESLDKRKRSGGHESLLHR